MRQDRMHVPRSQHAPLSKRPPSPARKATSVQSLRAQSVAALADQSVNPVEQSGSARGPGYSLASLPISPPDDLSPRDIRQAAGQGIRTPASRLPYAARIQQSFGHHDISGIQAHLGSQAARSAEAIRASAYTTGNHVVFARAADVRTVAHEAAHVVQQRAGVRLAQGVGRAGDRYEQHAEAVAQQVTAGQSAEELLDQVAGGHNESKGAITISAQLQPTVQNLQYVQRTITGSGAPAIPALSATATGTPQEGDCGYFERRRAWSVNPPVQGVIIQHIQRAFDVYKVNDVNMLTSAEIDDYVVSKGSAPYATENDYWELWEAEGSGTVKDGGEDTFSLCSIKGRGPSKNTTRGTFTITGTAEFYPTTAAPSTFGFNRGTVKAAGGLFSMTSAPHGLPAASGGQLTHTATVEWDSTYNEGTKQPDPYARYPTKASKTKSTGYAIGKPKQKRGYTNSKGLTILSVVTES
ncbi:MAG TPA: DUF4157 domain-containing protein [Ktedonobacteraceae bacterium]|nr:DUF4157 domain-containing protein [Ktedonobacteraceae bacterium]